MPKPIKFALIILGALALIPPVLIARARSVKTSRPPVHVIPDMDNQPRFKFQQANPMFLDKRAMRPRVEGTVPHGSLETDDHFHLGKVNGEFATEFPMPVTREVVDRGRRMYGIYCAVCHGFSGVGDGSVAVRAAELEEPAWVPPPSLHTDEYRGRVVGHIYNTITNGIRTMPAYGPQIKPADRWAIVSYVRALQLSQNAPADAVPQSIRESMP